MPPRRGDGVSNITEQLYFEFLEREGKAPISYRRAKRRRKNKKASHFVPNTVFALATGAGRVKRFRFYDMKKFVALSFAIATLAGAQSPKPQTWFVQGRILQVIEGKGILVSVIKSIAGGIPQPNDGSVVFVAGDFNPLMENHAIAMGASPNGLFRYEMVQGVAKTVAAFQFVTKRAPLPPMSP